MKQGYIFKRTRKNTYAMMFWAVLLFAFYALYMSSAFIYFINAYCSGYRLDTADLLSKNGDMQTIEAQEDPFPTSEYSVTIPPCIVRTILYEDGLKYRFQLTIEDYQEAGIGYGFAEDKTLSILYGNPDSKRLPPEARQKIAFVTIGGVRFIALLSADAEVKNGDVIPYALFTKAEKYVLHDLGLTEYAGTQVAPYVADLRNLIVDDETTDFLLVILFTLIFPTFLAYSILCLVNPKFHPNYLRIAKFGKIDEVCSEIDVEIHDESTYKEKRSIYTKHYIIEQTLYNTKVRKNHLLRH